MSFITFQEMTVCVFLFCLTYRNWDLNPSCSISLIGFDAVEPHLDCPFVVPPILKLFEAVV